LRYRALQLIDVDLTRGRRFVVPNEWTSPGQSLEWNRDIQVFPILNRLIGLAKGGSPVAGERIDQQFHQQLCRASLSNPSMTETNTSLVFPSKPDNGSYLKPLYPSRTKPDTFQRKCDGGILVGNPRTKVNDRGRGSLKQNRNAK